MQVLEQKEIVIGANNYLVTALDATYGLSVLNALMTMETAPPANFVKEVVLRSVKVNNIQPTEQWFNKHFEFDVNNANDPNVESDTSET